MGIFSKKKEKQQMPQCACNGACDVVEVETSIDDNCCCNGNCDCKLNIKVLGAGCDTCHKQYEYVQKAVEQAGIDADVEYITDIQKVMTYGVMSMPAIAINEKVVVMGKVLKPDDVVKILKKL